VVERTEQSRPATRKEPTMNPTSLRPGLEELAYRTTDGIDVTLLWSREDNSLTVVVNDSHSGEQLLVPVGGDSPLDVFHHPYAYAAFRGAIYLATEMEAAAA
jgi:hypothetical protein